nr:DsbA family protein [Cupriavidus sp. D39]
MQHVGECQDRLDVEPSVDRRFGDKLGPVEVQRIELTLMRTATGVQMRMPDRFQDFLRSVFHALWVDAEVKSQLRSTTEEAVKRGVFGAPTTFVGEHMFFGQDRLEWVCHALQGKPL